MYLGITARRIFYCISGGLGITTASHHALDTRSNPNARYGAARVPVQKNEDIVRLILGVC